MASERLHLFPWMGWGLKRSPVTILTYAQRSSASYHSQWQLREEPHRLLHKPFHLQCRSHFRTFADTRHIGAEVGICFEIYTNEIRPVNDGERVSVRNGEFAPHEVFPARELIVEPSEPLVDAGPGRVLDLI